MPVLSAYTPETDADEEIKSVVKKLSEALELLHNKFGYVHVDVKPDNIMCRQEAGRKSPKLIDFGSARQIAEFYKTPKHRQVPATGHARLRRTRTKSVSEAV